MFTVRRTEDVDEVRELHKMTFPTDEWIGDEAEYWIARDAAGRAVGFAAVTHRPETSIVSLDRMGVIPEANGHGLQRRLTRACLKWARKLDVAYAIAYVSSRNYASMVNLLACGFRFYEPVRTGKYEDEDQFHFLQFKF